MAVWCVLKEVVVFLFVLGISDAGTDLLETLDLSPSNPAELNDFLKNVLAHKDDFNWIRHASRKADSSNNMLDNRYQKHGMLFRHRKSDDYLKRSPESNRPMNDVYPYMYENLNQNSEASNYRRKSRHLRRKRKRRRRQRRQRRSRGSVNLDLSNEQESGEVNVVPRSQLGVLKVPGMKYSSRHGKKCEEELSTHDIVLPSVSENNTGNSTGNNTVNCTKIDTQPEYYYSGPHDVLGLAQDISKENEDKNKSCCVHTRSVIPTNNFKPATVATTTVRKIYPSLLDTTKKFDNNRFNIRPQYQPQQIQPTFHPMQYQFQPVAQQFPTMYNDLRQNQSFTGMVTPNDNQDVVKLQAYVETPNRDVPIITKQDLLNVDSDNVLQNIDRVLKSDRTGLKMYNGQSIIPVVRKSTNDNENHAYRYFSQSQTQNNMFPIDKLPLARRASLIQNYTDKKTRSIIKDGNENSDEDKNDLNSKIKIDFNSRPLDKNIMRRKSNKRKSKENSIPKKASYNIKNPNGYSDTIPRHMHNMNTPLRKNEMNELKNRIQNVLSEQKKLFEDSIRNMGQTNVKVMGNDVKNDEIPNELKGTIKEYENRQKEYRLGKNPYEEEEDVTPDYSLVQEKKNLLEDQTEPTSAAEQRELGRKDNEFVTPSMNESDGDTLIVIPLKKNILSDTVASYRGGDVDQQREGFKVKESKDMIHGLEHRYSKTNGLETKDLSDSDEELNRDDYLEIIKSKQKHSAIDEEREEDYAYDASARADDKLERELDPSNIANIDYNYYENFDQKREIQTTSGTVDKFQSRKLKTIDKMPEVNEANLYENIDYSNGDIKEVNVRSKRNSDTFEFSHNDESLINYEEQIQKRSENEESDEEPGNDSKNAEYKAKKVTETTVTQNTKKEDDGITLTMTKYAIKFNHSLSDDYPPDDENEPKLLTFDDSNINENSTSENSPTVTNNYYNVTINIMKPSGPENTTEGIQNFDNVTQIETSELKTEQTAYEYNTSALSNALIGDVVTTRTGSIDSEEEMDQNDKVEDGEEQTKRSDENVDTTQDTSPNDENNSKEEQLAKRLKELIALYKSQLKLLSDAHENENRQSIMRHKTGPKRTHSIPHEACVADNEDNEYYQQKQTNSNQFQAPRPLQEGYNDVESMDDDLKEQILIQKIYDSVVKKRKSKFKELNDADLQELFDENLMDSCPVDFDEEINDEKKKKKEDVIRNKAEELSTNEKENNDAILRERKKASHVERAKKKKVSQTNEDLDQNANVKLTQREAMNKDAKIQFDNIDSFKDVVEEHPKIRKRQNNLKDFPNAYLSPIEEGSEKENHRVRRRLRYLSRRRKQVQAANYEATSPNTNADTNADTNQPQLTNFQNSQNVNVDNETKKMESTINGESQRTTPQTNIHFQHYPNGSVPVVKAEKNCTELDAIKANRTKLEECLEKKKESEDLKNMLCGHFAMNIIELFFGKLKENSALYSRFGSSISTSKQCASESVSELSKFREEQAKVDIKHAEDMLHEVILMLNRIVADQVHRRTCLQLSPNLKLFVIRITKNMRNFKKNNQIAEGLPLPKIKSRHDDDPLTPSPDEVQGDFLFSDSDSDSNTGNENEKTNERSDIQKKIKLIEKLLEKYQKLSMHCQVQVEPVKDYLLKHLGMLMKLLEKASSAESSTCKTTSKPSDPEVCDDEIAPPHDTGGGNDANCNANSADTCLEETSATNSCAPTPPTPGMQQLPPQQVQPQFQQQQMQAPQMQEPQIQVPQMQEPQMQAPQMQEPQMQAPQMQQNTLPQLHTRKSENEDKHSYIRQSSIDSANQAAITNANQNQSLSQQNHPAENAATTIVNKELQGDGVKYTNPELVSKDLLNMGLGGGNSYLPPFDIHGMVEERVLKSAMNAGKGNAGNANAGNGNPGNANPGNANPGGCGAPPNNLGSPMTSRFQSLLMQQMKRRAPKNSMERHKRMSEEKENESENEGLNKEARGCDISNYTKKTNLANYGKEQFFEQPLLVNATAIPDPSIEDTEMYSGQKYSNPEMVNNDLSNLGLDGEINSYIIPLQLDTVVQVQEKADASHSEPHFPMMKPATLPHKKKRSLEDDNKAQLIVSEKYKKLIDTVANMREKRQNDERIGKLYGSKLETNEKLASVKSRNKEMQDISKLTFERPVVYSLE